MRYRFLKEHEESICRQTMGAYAFHHVVADALMRRHPLSVIRVSDGEKRALDYAEGKQPDDLMLCCDEGFRKAFGVEGITCGMLNHRIHTAATRCTHFAPTLGFFNESYDLTPYFAYLMNTFDRPQFVCEMFQYHWSLKMRKTLMELAGDVLIINRDPVVLDNMKQMMGTSARVSQVHLNNWDGAEEALGEAIARNPRLTLMSAALGSKYIGPYLANMTNSVVLDIGQAANVWHLE